MKIPHSKPFLPPVGEYKKRIDEVWNNGWLTNHGPLVREFEKEIAAYLKVSHVSCVSSGTMGLQCALRTLPRGGEIITTPYSYVATAGAVFWEGFKPVFADIEPGSLALDPLRVAEKITPDTRAVLATHVYGLPAQVDALEDLCRAQKLPLMYDAAHAFGVEQQGRSLLSYGDYSVLSLHATKVFHTANGGLVVSRTAEGKALIDGYRNFGHDGPNHFPLPGINGKNSELHAALGLSILPYADMLLEERRSQWQRYRELLSFLPERHFLNPSAETLHNGSYFPLLHLDAAFAERAISALLAAGIEGRRYFYPALNTISYLNGTTCPIAERVASSVFCLPLYHGLSHKDQSMITEIILKHR